MVAKKREDRYPDWGRAPGKGRDVSMVEPKREARRTILLGSGCKREGRVHGGVKKGGPVEPCREKGGTSFHEKVRGGGGGRGLGPCILR